MKKRTLSLVAPLLLLFPFFASAQTERVYVVTDRPAYLAGDRIWCSLSCFDKNGRISPQSSVAYMELISTDESVLQAKIALFNGRGAGEFVIPAQVPTGNYRLVAYTSLEGGEHSHMGSRLLSVYNTSSLSRVQGGVTLGQKPKPVLEEDTDAGIRVDVPSTVRRGAPFSLLLRGMEGADVSVSVYHEDELAQLRSENLSSFLRNFPISEPDKGVLEYDGEIIRASLRNGEETGKTAILSSAGSSEDTYITKVAPEGMLEFYTSNIFGDREMVCEVLNARENVRIQILSPFEHPSAGPVPSLLLHQDMYGELVHRKYALTSPYPADTLARFLPHRKDVFLSGINWEHIHLDDYVRFPSLQEITVEIMPAARIRYKGKTPVMELSIPDATGSSQIFMDHILTMMDGVIVTDLSLLLRFDAMLLDDIYFCRERIVLGDVVYNGVINLVSKKNYVTALDFPNNVCIVDFKGARYPVAYLGEKPEGEDYRQLLYWHPALTLKGNEIISLTAPSYSGKFCVVAEGLAPDGTPLRAVSHFEVE